MKEFSESDKRYDLIGVHEEWRAMDRVESEIMIFVSMLGENFQYRSANEFYYRLCGMLTMLHLLGLIESEERRNIQDCLECCMNRVYFFLSEE